MANAARSGPRGTGRPGATGGQGLGRIEVLGNGPGLASPLRIIDAGADLLREQARRVAQLDRSVGRSPQVARIDRSDIVHALRPFTYLTSDGVASGSWRQQITAAPCSGHMSTADGRHIYMANVVRRLRDGTLRLLGCEPTREAVQAAVADWQSTELEDAMADAGLPLTIVRNLDEWSAHPQGHAMRDSPLVAVAEGAETAPESVPSGDRTLDGLRVIDLTHVVAGPMLTRGLAEYGADVLHIGPPDDDLQDPVAVTDELMIGKRSLRIDLKSSRGRKEIEHLIEQADVLVQSWRPGVMTKLGLEHDRLARLRPGLIQIDVSCFGPTGPWAGRPGFDGNALAAVGATALEAEHGPPKLSPPGVLTDSLVGFLGVSVVCDMLLRRAQDGGTRSAHLSLARTAMWLMDRGLTAPGTDVAPEQWGTPRMRNAVDENGASLEHVEHPIRYAERPARLNGKRPAIGSSTPAWIGHQAGHR